MIRFSNNGLLVQSVEELSLLPRTGDLLFLDFETKSCNPKQSSLNPWHHCYPIGFAYTVDDYPNVYFVPWEIILQDTTGFLWSLISSAKCWINHHVKYDAHVLLNHTGWTLPEELQLVCTLMMAHLIDADRSYKGGYGLDHLAYDWCGVNIFGYYDRIKPYLYRNDKKFNEDYGQIALDLLAEYACADVFTNRILYDYSIANMPPEAFYTGTPDFPTPALLSTEIELTKTLLQAERNGLYIIPLEVQIAEYQCARRMLDIEETLHHHLGYYINPGSTDQLYDLICNRFGLPVFRWTNIDKDGKETDRSNPSFDAKTLKAYRNSVDTPPLLRDVIKLVLAYKKEAQQKSLFYTPWQILHVDGFLHGNYVQNVRSGRMACKQPNEQQFDKRAKKLIRPRPGYVMLAHDYSQVEYRIIVHYLGNPKAIKAYEDNPDTDYHVWVSVICKIDRQPAKTMNFLMAFGGGKKKAIATLAANFLDAGMKLSASELIALGEKVYAQYHANLPELKQRSRDAQNAARANGFVRNGAGRRLHLPGQWHNRQYTKDGRLIDRCHIAFNRAVQSFASDIAKERAVAIVKEPWFKAYGLELIGLVHDAFYFQMPDRPDKEIVRINNQIREFLEATPFKLKVKLRVDSGYSRKNMADTDAPRYCDLPIGTEAEIATWDMERCCGGKHTRASKSIEWAEIPIEFAAEKILSYI